MPSHWRYSLLLGEIDAWCARTGSPGVALLLIQLSGLEEVNSRFGYPGGDRLLEEITRRLGAVGRAQDRVLAVNSRTFALLIDNPLHESHAVLAADKVVRCTAEPVVIGAAQARIRCCIGVSRLPDPARSAEELLRQCEVALAAARSRDEPHVVFAPALLAAPATAGSYAWFDIEEALRASEFEVFYQPQVDLRTGQLAGAEALVRWHRPQAGYVPPGHFMPAIENSQGIRAILWFVLNSALRQAAAWAVQWPGFSVSVNLATGNLSDPDLVDIVEDALNVWSLPPEQLTLELTEGSLMENPEASARTMGRLRDLGVRMSIDDFGTGYSSLAYLRDLPADELKIDRSFVARVLAADRDRDIVASIVQLAHAVKLKVVAEGIEEAATRAAMAAMGCDYGQGFHFAPPLAAPDFAAAWIDRASECKSG